MSPGTGGGGEYPFSSFSLLPSQNCAWFPEVTKKAGLSLLTRHSFREEISIPFTPPPPLLPQVPPCSSGTGSRNLSRRGDLVCSAVNIKMSQALGANGLSISPCGVRHLPLEGTNGAGKVVGGDFRWWDGGVLRGFRRRGRGINPSA